MRKTSLLIAQFLVASLLFACQPLSQPSDQTIQTAVAQTQVAQPTSTPVPFAEMDLNGILIQQGDLPSNFEPGQIKYDWPVETKFPMKVKPSNIILQMFKEKGDSFNLPHFSMLALYDVQADAKKSYDSIYSAFDFQLGAPIAGDRSSVLRYEAGTELLTVKVTVVMTQRCNALTVIRFIDFKDNDAFAYVKGLDKRVQKIACR